MRSGFVMAGAAVVLSVILSLPSESAKAAGIVAWTNSQTKNDKTVFPVKPGQVVTFSVKAEGAAKYIWQVNGQIKLQVKGGSFKWTVPDKKGLWKVRVKAANKSLEQYVAGLVGDFKKFHKKDIPEVIKDGYYPPRCRKEWIVSTFLKTVKPGESIAKAVEAVPSEGGIVQLLPGVHNVNETIHINKSNVTIQGDHETEVRFSEKAKSPVFSVREKSQGNLHLENVTFRGFKVTSTGKGEKGQGKHFVSAIQVNDLTIEGVRAKPFLGGFVSVSVWKKNWGKAKNLRMRIFNNNIEKCNIVGYWCENSVIAYNSLRGFTGGTGYGMYMEVGNTYISIHDNLVENAGANANIQTESHCAHIFNNICKGSRGGIMVKVSPSNVRVENNIITGAGSAASDSGILLIRQGGMHNEIVRNNIIYNCKAHGICVSEYGYGMSGSGDASILNNVIYNNGGDGIHQRRRTDWTLNVANNIIAKNGGYGINYIKTKNPITIKGNNLWKNAKGNYHNASAGAGDVSADPLFADPSKGDFHLKSKAGRWDPKAKKWVKDNVTSPCIDAGEPKGDFSKEPAPNGGRVNMGAYGNTAEASKSSAQ